MAAARTGSSDAFGSAITRLSLARPAGASRGEATLVVAVSNDSAPIEPGGVGLAALRTGTFASCFYWIGWRADDGAASIAFSFSRSDSAAWGMQISYRDADPTTPFVAGAPGGGTGLRWTATGITVGDDTLVDLIGTYNFTVTRSTLPADFPAVTIGDEGLFVAGERTYVAGAATGDQVITASSSQASADWLAFLVAVAAAPRAAPPFPRRHRGLIMRPRR